MYSPFNSFDLQSSWMSIIMPSGATQCKAHQQGHIQGLSLIRITPLIWIKILEASWLTAVNHFDVLLKRASRLMCANTPLLSCRLLCTNYSVCLFWVSVWESLTPRSYNHAQQDHLPKKEIFPLIVFIPLEFSATHSYVPASSCWKYGISRTPLVFLMSTFLGKGTLSTLLQLIEGAGLWKDRRMWLIMSDKSLCCFFIINLCH